MGFKTYTFHPSEGDGKIRNSKQIQMTKTRNDLIRRFLFRILKIRISRLFCISIFVFFMLFL